MLFKQLFARSLYVAAIAFTFWGLACSGERMGQSDGTTSTGTMRITGAGSTFVKPLMDKWTAEFGKLNPSIRIDYSGGGSGQGIKAVQNQTSDFGGTDAALTDDEQAGAAGGEVLHIPVVLGAVVMTYNLEGLKEPLKLTPEVISDIYLGKIHKWNDERIKRENPDAALPSSDITPVFRADGSGTSDIFTDYLAKTVPEWKERIGRTKNPQLPKGIGIGGKGNEGVMGQVKNTPNTIGYVELTFAKANNLPSALIKNKSGNFVEAGHESVSKAAEGMVERMPDDLRFEITDADGAGAYPISGIVFMLVYKDQRDAGKAKAIADFLWWAITDGEQYVIDLHYAPLPESLVERTKAKIDLISSGGKPVRSS
jgi:phosphate transport system substrate-binding protein